MRVFQLNTFCGVKSTGRIATDIALALEARGGECRIGYGVPGVPAEYERFAYRVGTAWERKLHGAIRKFLDGEGYGSQMATLGLIREIRRFGPDVIHLHNIHGCYLHFRLLFRYLKSCGIPVVWTLHDCWAMTGHCAYFEYARCFKWQRECGDCPQLRAYPTCLGLDGSKRNLRQKKRLFSGLESLTWVAPSHWLRAYVEASWLKQYPVRVIRNGVDVSVFQPSTDEGMKRKLREKHGLNGRYLALAVASDWDGRKGLRFLLQAAEKWGSKVRLAVIGLSAEQADALPRGVLGLGATASARELAAWYSLADCLVNPTMEDNLPMVNLEALACGTPVVAFHTGGCPEVVDETCGLIVPQGDAEALAEAVLSVIPRKKALSPACIRRAGQHDSRVCYESYLNLYEELVP